MASITPVISKTLQEELEKFQSDNLAVVEKIQSIYISNHRVFFQGIETPSTLPDEKTKEIDADLTKRPTDQAEKWEDVFKGVDLLPTKFPGTLRFDVYDGPRGKGWTMTIACAEDGKRQEKTWNFGPETERHDKDWRVVEIPK